MATFTAIKNRGGGRGALGGVLRYVQQKEKTTWKDRRLVSGWNCTAQSVYDEMRLTKEQFHKTDGRQYYHFVQSFGEQDGLPPPEVHSMGLELAQREFPNFEVLVATHVDTGHFHNHLVVNSVSFQDGGIHLSDGERRISGTLDGQPEEHHLHNAQGNEVPGRSALRGKVHQGGHRT